MKSISIIMGSASDLNIIKETVNVLKDFKVSFEVRILSAHRTPKELAQYVATAPKRGIKVFIAAAGMSAALSGVIAAHSVLPVIGIPIESGSLKGLDALLSTVMMPPGIPVASMAVGKAGARNAALFALEILGLHDKRIQAKLLKHKKSMRVKIKKTKIKL